MTLYDELSTSLQEAIDGVKGQGEIKITQVKIIPVKEFTSEEIKDIRHKSKMSQKVFAGFMGVSNKTIEAWEAGTKRPSGTARRLLSMIETDESLMVNFPFVTSI